MGWIGTQNFPLTGLKVSSRRTKEISRSTNNSKTCNSQYRYGWANMTLYLEKIMWVSQSITISNDWRSPNSYKLYCKVTIFQCGTTLHILTKSSFIESSSKLGIPLKHPLLTMVWSFVTKTLLHIKLKYIGQQSLRDKLPKICWPELRTKQKESKTTSQGQ